MAIYRGDGGAGDATNDITINQITELSSETQIYADAAASSATDAETSASEASTSATNAANSATSAGTSATNAASSASSASTSASNASTSETNAAASETAAAASEAAAALSETAAAASETNAASSASSASTSASTATTQATSAATSATNAATSASAASTSETNAATSETNAATSETNAASSATSASTDAATATTKASEASTSASNAATSETNAAASESAAATSATNASTSETNAAASETAAASSASAAATSETNAATSASGAATSASSAATSASNASASADAALSALDNFDDRYLGQKTSDPTTDNDGDALVAGALYFNTTDDVMKVYEGSTWVAAYASLSGALLASNNLSDLNNVSTARTNLGLGTAATTASTDYVAVTGDTMTGDLSFGDNDKAIFGAGSDLQIFSDGAKSYLIEGGTGDLEIRATDLIVKNADNTKIMASFNDGGTSQLRYDDSVKLATTSTGVDITGTLTSDGLTVGGSNFANTTYTGSSVNLTGVYTGLTSDGGFAVNVRDSGYLQFSTSDTERMRIDSSGNVGIGASTVDSALHIEVPNPLVTLEDSTNALKAAVNGENGNLVLSADTANASGSASYIGFEVDTSEAMRITSLGALLVGTTTNSIGGTNYLGCVITKTTRLLALNKTAAGSATMISFNSSGTQVGSIVSSASATNYNTSSDYRLKEDVQPMEQSIERVKQLNPVNFAWRLDGSRVDGFLAHEAAEVVPEAVSGTKDAVELWEEGDELPEGVVVGDNKLDDDGNTIPDYQGIDQAKLIPLLTSALQEAIGRIETLEAEVTALKG